MYRTARLLAGAGLLVLIIVSAAPLAAQQTKKVLTFADEGIVRNVAQLVLSPDGVYVAFTVTPAEGDGEVIIRHIASGQEYKFPRGGGISSPRFTPDGKRALVPLTPTKAEIDKAKADKLKSDDLPQPALAIVDLATGAIVEKLPQVGNFTLGGDGAGFIIYRKLPRGSAVGTDTGKSEIPAGPMGGPGSGKFGGGKGGGKFGGSVQPGASPTTPPTTPGINYGTDLIIRDLATKAERVIPDVTDFSLTKDSKVLVYTVSSRKDETNGVYVVNPRSVGVGEAIKSGPGRYTSLTWDEKQTKLAFLYDDSVVTPPNQAPMPRPAGSAVAVQTPPAPPVPARWRALVWDRHAKPVTTPSTRLPMGAIGGFATLLPVALLDNQPTIAPADEVLGPTTPGQRPGWTFAGGSLSFSADGTKLFVNTAPKREPAPPAGPPRQDDFSLEIWHWKDERLQPAQKLQASADQSRTYSAVVMLDTKAFRQLSDETITVTSPTSGEWAVGRDDRKYRHMTGYMSPLPSDYALVNIRTGQTRPVLQAFKSGLSLSPNGKYLIGFDGKDWFTISVPDGMKVNLTEKLKVKFYNEDDDHPHAPPPAGQPQWTADGKYILVNDRYDIWKLAADGSSAENLTKIGRPQHIRFTLTRVPTDDETEPARSVDLSKPHLLAAENLRTRDTGFYRLEPGSEPKLLVMGARRYGTPTRAKNANVYLLTVQTFYDFPDYFVTDANFHELKRVTDANPKLREYNWGKAELIHYSSADGTPLSGILIKPENFDPSKKYPMVVYIYERLSQNLHQFRAPTVGTSINPTFYASNGYLVLMPDIAYKVGSPGQSALKCVLPAIQAVVDKGYVKEDGIGIQGHSWGGYQISYMITQTDRFKAAIAGAPVSNMISAYGGIRWGSGLTRQFQYEWTQSRIGANLWEAPMKYIENSPIFMADRVKTPLMILHNDQDDAVPWYQGIEYYLALRRLGKECYMLNYNGQPHGITNRAAQRDYSVRMFQFFEHHLNGKPAPEWMEKGVPYLDAAKEKEQWKKLFSPEKK